MKIGRLFRVIICVSSLLTDAEKQAMAADFKNAVDTFVRPFTIYQEANRTVVITDPTYNPLEAYNQNNTEIQNIPVFNTISGRIMYDKNQEWSFMRPYVSRGTDEGQLKVKDQTVRSVRLKVDYSGYMLLNTAKKTDIDGYLFDVQSIARPHGLFSPDYYTFYFVRSL